MKEYVSLEEAAVRFHRSVCWVRRQIQAGVLTATRLGRRVLISTDELERLLEEGTQPTPHLSYRQEPPPTFLQWHR